MKFIVLDEYLYLLFSHCCEDPGIGQYATITYKSITNDTKYLTAGHYFTFVCHSGYEHSDGLNIKNLTCLHNGSWSYPHTAPSCTPIKCQDPRESNSNSNKYNNNNIVT